VKIVSLLPSATEIVFALGRGDDLRGVTFECDFPPEARGLPVVSSSGLEAPGGAPEAIDAAVREATAGGEPLYRLDDAAIAAIGPDVILTQDLCRVCAVPSGDVDAALDRLGCRAEVVSLDPTSLDDVLDDIERVGRAIGAEVQAAEVVAGLRRRLAAVEAAVAGRDRPRVLVLEWVDPPFGAGHWIPGMLEAAGAEPVLGRATLPSEPLTWEAIRAEAADAVVVAPCGFGLDGSLAHAAQARDHLGPGAVWAIDGDAFIVRPGPRLVDGVEILAGLFHPGAVPAPPPGTTAAVA
jgi:iron complex transport system substrate-binding protein